jgi:hypothetical protein
MKLTQYGHAESLKLAKALERKRGGITEVAADDAVPGGPVVLVELLLDVLRDVFLHGVLLERLRSNSR